MASIFLGLAQLVLGRLTPTLLLHQLLVRGHELIVGDGASPRRLRQFAHANVIDGGHQQG